ncbi:hypothetical protein [Propionivibrio sp.]|uniref:hypothetical protein n=1 Tax=Propionivibrio sp. TaxID=2212460 RepID=UPI0039E3D375
MKTAPGDLVDRVGLQGAGARRADPPGRVASRVMLLALAAVFVLPFAVGSGLFWSGWRPAALRNHGELVQPPRALPAGVAALHGKWLLIVPARDGGGPACQETLHRLRQAHAALGKERDRVQRVLVGAGIPADLLPLQGGGREGDGADAIADGLVPHPHPSPPLEGEGARAPFSGLTIVSPAADDAAWRRALDGYAPAVFVADPLGNVMMRYDEPIDARHVLRDMERLLKYSWVR